MPAPPRPFAHTPPQAGGGAPLTRPARRRVLIGCLAVPLAPILLWAFALAVSDTARELSCIGLLAAPVGPVRAKAADNLRHFRTDRSTAALVAVLNRVDPKEDERLARNALRSLCIITDRDFCGYYKKTSVSIEFGWPPRDPWPEVVAKINAWALGRTVESGTSPAGPADPPAASAPGQTSEAVRTLIDQIADADGGKAAKAWAELGARFQSSGAYLGEVRAALGDARPLAFRFRLESFASPGNPTFKYFSPIPNSSLDTRTDVSARTVGQALRLHLWAYEDASHSGFQGTFDEWWAAYAAPRGLPVD